MPTNESEELARIRQAAELVRTLLWLQPRDEPKMSLNVETVRLIEQQLWSAYALAQELAGEGVTVTPAEY